MTIYRYTNEIGSNQYQTKYRPSFSLGKAFIFSTAVFVVTCAVYGKRPHTFQQGTAGDLWNKYGITVDYRPYDLVVKPVFADSAITTPTPKPSPTVPNIVAYIATKWETHGTGEVVKAINCFYSESGLRANAVGQNSDEPRSKDHGVAQLNDYWHNLSEEEKTDFVKNIDRAYKIYQGRGNKFAVSKGGAWYGKGCE